MTAAETAGLTVLLLMLFLGIFGSVLGLPGTVLILTGVLVYALATGFAQIGLKLLLALAAIAVLAELADFGLEAASGVRLRFSVRGTAAALAGSLAAAVLLTPFLLGLGTLLGIFLGGGLTVFAAEMLRRQRLKPAFRVGMRAMLQRTAGLAVKGLLSVAMAAMALFAVYS